MSTWDTFLQGTERELKMTTLDEARFTRKLNESGLPKEVKEKLRKRFEPAGNIDGLDKAIAAEKEYRRIR